MTILVTAATGKVAHQATRRLLAAGQPVRLLVRDQAKAEAAFGPAGRHLSYVVGAFDDPAVLADAFSDARIAFLGLGTGEEQERLERGLIDAARLHDTPHVVRLSVLKADPGATYEVARRHGVLDAHLAASGTPSTVLRPSFFMSNLLLSAASIAAAGRWFGAIPTGRIAMIDARDVGNAAAAVILDASLQGGAYDLTGAEAVTMAEVAARLTSLLGRDVLYVPADEATLRRGYAARGVPAWLTEYALGIDRGMEAGDHAGVTDVLSSLTAKPPRSLTSFLVDHRAAFAAGASPVT